MIIQFANGAELSASSVEERHIPCKYPNGNIEYKDTISIECTGANQPLSYYVELCTPENMAALTVTNAGTSYILSGYTGAPTITRSVRDNGQILSIMADQGV